MGAAGRGTTWNFRGRKRCRSKNKDGERKDGGRMRELNFDAAKIPDVFESSSPAGRAEVNAFSIRDFAYAFIPYSPCATAPLTTDSPPSGQGVFSKAIDPLSTKDFQKNTEKDADSASTFDASRGASPTSDRPTIHSYHCASGLASSMVGRLGISTFTIRLSRFSLFHGLR
ncbi:hypothetical protein KM043_006153 [Ampulex compressa]|nr:hypothetical protein KM043_006153 [Ampulex compressa]